MSPPPTGAVPFGVVPDGPLTFGGAASNTPGEQHGSQSLFPPPLSAWQGLVRTRLLRAANSLKYPLSDYSEPAIREREALVGGPDALLPGWALRGPWPAVLGPHGAEPWFPIPAWLRVPPKGEGVPEPAHRLPPAALRGLLSGVGAGEGGAAGRLNGDVGRAATGWVTARALAQILAGLPPTGEWPGHAERKARANLTLAERISGVWGWGDELPPFVHKELRPGLAIENGTAVEGMLYFDQALRFEDGAGLVGTLAEPSPRPAPHPLHEGPGSLGRKGRSVTFRDVRLSPELADIERGAWLPGNGEDVWAWLYLASDWYPADTEGASLSAARRETRIDPARPPLPEGVEVVQAILGKPVWHSGYSLVKRATRPTRPLVPAGSAWLLRARGPGAADRLRALHGSQGLLRGNVARAAFGEALTWVGLAPSSSTLPRSPGALP